MTGSKYFRQVGLVSHVSSYELSKTPDSAESTDATE